jgi:hypothetical protein
MYESGLPVQDSRGPGSSAHRRPAVTLPLCEDSHRNPALEDQIVVLCAGRFSILDSGFWILDFKKGDETRCDGVN